MNQSESGTPNRVERSPNLTLNLLREAFNTKNREQLRMIVDGIKRMVDDVEKPLSVFMTENDLDDMLRTGEGVILVGTGTAGQRIFINANRGDLHMSEDKHGEDYRTRFRRIFDIPIDVEARVSF